MAVAQHLPRGRHQAGDRHLKFHEDRDNLLTMAAKPADRNHDYGHGKAEYLSAGAEGLMIFVAAGVCAS